MPADNKSRKVAIVGYNRIPFARNNTAYAKASNQDMMTAALNGLIARYHLQGKLLGGLAGGAVIKNGFEMNLIRDVVLSTSLDPRTPACEIQQACATGIESAMYIANKIALGLIDVGVAGGTDSTNNLALPHNQYIHQDIRAMGSYAEIAARDHRISRQAQDQLAMESHQKMAKAYERGFFNDMITPYLGLERDNNLSIDISMEKLAKLKPAFSNDTQRATVTTGNSFTFLDGASCLLLASEEWAKQNGLPIFAYITHAESAAIEYKKRPYQFWFSPVYAATRMLQKAGLTLQDFDFYEIHEASAGQVLATLKIWESAELSKEFGFDKPLGAIDRSKLNVNGSSLAAGHPFAATGGRVLATLAKLLHEKGSGRGLVSVCAAGGQGITVILEK